LGSESAGLEQASGDVVGEVAEAERGAVCEVGDAVSDAADAVGDAATAVGSFVEEHKATIAGIATGIVVYAGCTGATGGGGAVACAAVAGAAGRVPAGRGLPLHIRHER
jgi:hypothetical protein